MIDSTLKNANILIVDDQQENIEILTLLLDAKGYTNYTSTTDPRTVLDLFTKFKPDLLLLDLQMPELSGLQVMEKLKDIIPTDSYFPTLILTADKTHESKQKALSGGASDFLTKPFDLVEVNLRIKNLLQTRYLHQQLESHNRSLEEKIKERTEELQKTNIDLVTAKEKAEEMNRLKSCFLASMSHELRTPLIAVLGFAELLQQELTAPEQKDLVQQITDGGNRLNDTLSSILEWSRLESEVSTLTLSPINLAGEIEKNIALYSSMAKAKNLFIRTEFSDTTITANINAELFGKAFCQLLHNAIKFTRYGGVFATLNQFNKDGVEWAVVQIIDTGIGIAKEFNEAIFREFRQESEGLNRSHEGSGLGLSIAKKMIELMNGKIEVESEVGKGSTFSVWFPAVLDSQALKAKVEQKRKTIEFESLVKNTDVLPAVLLIEDNQPNRLVITRMLRQDFLIREVEDGFSGIALASQKIFDVVLIDVNLGPGLDGIDTMQEIRKLSGYEKVPILAVTAYAMESDRDRLLKKGFDDYLKKPFSKEELIDLIRRQERK
jgi:signal transduction histidine kinase